MSVKTMPAYLIDPFARTVTRVGVRAKGSDIELAHAYELMQCDYIEAINPASAGRDVIYLDEHGKFKEHNASFICRLWPYETLLGRALWIGCDGDGGNKAPDMTLEYVAGHIAFEVWS
jgi:hypothetical protein